jgi:hypothetical protein
MHTKCDYYGSLTCIDGWGLVLRDKNVLYNLFWYI